MEQESNESCVRWSYRKLGQTSLDAEGLAATTIARSKVQRAANMPDDPKHATQFPDLINALCTAVAVLSACGLVWVALTWEPLR